jgi:uncharacterized protein YaiE (UPF0345 family)
MVDMASADWKEPAILGALTLPAFHLHSLAFPATDPAMTDKINATVSTRANVYFDGKCVSHSIELPDGSKKSVGVILPSTLHFSTGEPEVMELVEGACRVKYAGSNEWQAYGAGQNFNVPGQSSFDIEVTQTLHYVCHFG